MFTADQTVTSLSNLPSSEIQRAAPIASQIQGLRATSERLHKSIAALLEKITPVLGSVPESAVTKPCSDSPGNSPVVCELHSITENLQVAIDRLQYATSAVEL